MLVATGAALRQSIDLIASLEIDRSRMHANIETTKGLALAEAASFALSIHLPRPEAQALVKKSCKMVLADGPPHRPARATHRCARGLGRFAPPGQPARPGRGLH